MFILIPMFPSFTVFSMIDMQVLDRENVDLFEGVSSQNPHSKVRISWSKIFTACNSIGFRPGLGIHSFQKNAMFSRSFAFFSKELNVLAFFCVLYKKNETFSAFCYVFYKRTRCSLHSFTFFIKECGVLLLSL